MSWKDYVPAVLAGTDAPQSETAPTRETEQDRLGNQETLGRTILGGLTALAFSLACAGGAPSTVDPAPAPATDLPAEPAWTGTAVRPFSEAVKDGLACSEPWQRTYNSDGSMAGDPWGGENDDPTAWTGAWTQSGGRLEVTGLEADKQLPPCPDARVWSDGDTSAILCHQRLIPCEGTQPYWVLVNGNADSADAVGRALVEGKGTMARPRQPVPVVRGDATAKALVVTYAPGVDMDPLGGDLFEAIAKEVAAKVEAALGVKPEVKADPGAVAPVVVDAAR